MKNKYLALIMAVIMCFTLFCGTVAAAEDLPVSGEQLSDIVEGVIGEDPSEIGGEIMDGIYEGQGILQTIYDVLENIKILFANLINTVFGYFDIGGNSLFG